MNYPMPWWCSIADFRTQHRGLSMTTITIQEAQAMLPDLIHRLVPGEDVVITENDQPVAKLVSELPQPMAGLRLPPGLGKGIITIVEDDGDHLMDFEEYMP